MSDYKVRFEPTDDPGLERFQIEGPDSFVMGMAGTPEAVATAFGNATNPARWRLLRSFRSPVAWIDRVKVAEGKRGQGLGTAVMREALRILGEAGIRHVILSPRADKGIDPVRLDEFYRRLGFEQVRSFRGSTLWSPLMVIDLSA